MGTAAHERRGDVTDGEAERASALWHSAAVRGRRARVALRPAAVRALRPAPGNTRRGDPAHDADAHGAVEQEARVLLGGVRHESGWRDDGDQCDGGPGGSGCGDAFTAPE